MLSSDPAFHHDPRHELAREETLALLALGEQVDADADAHVRGCPGCLAELAKLEHTVALGRHVDEQGSDLPADPAAVPSSAVWLAITAELDTAPVAAAAVDRADRRQHPTRPHGVRRGWVALAAAVALVVGAGTAGGYALGRSEDPGVSSIAATAQLNQMPGGPAGVRGVATVRDVAGAPHVTVRAVDLPLRDGYYEVWLFDPEANKMVAVGALPQGGEASFPVPPGLNVRAYHVVDISAQDYDGDPAHKQSVLRGALTQ